MIEIETNVAHFGVPDVAARIRPFVHRSPNLNGCPKLLVFAQRICPVALFVVRPTYGQSECCPIITVIIIQYGHATSNDQLRSGWMKRTQRVP